MTPIASHGLTIHRIRPRTTPAIAHLTCGVMLTPFIHPGPWTPDPAPLPLAYSASAHVWISAARRRPAAEYAAGLHDRDLGEGRRDARDAGGSRGQRAADPQP